MNSPEYDAWLAEETIQIKALQEEHGRNAYHEGEYWPSCCSRTVLKGELEFRFCYLMDQLNERFPGVNNPIMSYDHEGRLVRALDKLLLEHRILKDEHNNKGNKMKKIACFFGVHELDTWELIENREHVTYDSYTDMWMDTGSVRQYISTCKHCGTLKTKRVRIK